MAMGDRGPRRGACAPFYAPPRRKTSAEIISEARAAIFDEMSGNSSGSSVGGLRPLRTRRPFTPREPQRTLFTDRARKRDPRPPSAFDLKYLSLSEDNEGVQTSSRITSFAEEDSSPVHKTENKHTKKKDNSIKDGVTWSGFTKLPHLSGRSKPLHRRNTTGQITVEGATISPCSNPTLSVHFSSKPSLPTPSTISNLSQSILVTKPLGVKSDLESTKDITKDLQGNKRHVDTAVNKRRTFGLIKSVSCDAGSGIGDIPVRHLALQLPNTSSDHYESMTTLELAEALATQSSHDVEKTLLLLEPLQNILEQSTPSSNLRELVIRSLYVHIDNEDNRILVAIARAMLTMRVTGKHLAAASKLVFKIARDDKNDHYFRNSNLLELLVEGCGRADPLAESECCVYGAGALRFLALEPRLCVLAHEAGALHLAALHLKIFNNAKAERPRQVREHATHALYQLTGALRNLANGGAKTATAFVSSGALGELLAALPLHTDRDVLTNVARCLSVLSAEDACCEWLCTSPCSARALLRTLAACASRAALAVRLTYTLGNMAAADEQARINIYNEEGGIDVILTILESYTSRKDRDTKDLEEDTDLHLVGSDLGGSDGSNEDVLIKTVRVVANLCLSDLAGRGVAMHHAKRTIRALLACLDVAERSSDKLVCETTLKRQVSEREISDDNWNMDRREELATAALATLNNITFYLEPTDTLDPLDDNIEQLCKATCRWLHKAGDGSRLSACEAVRALGNLSRSNRAARWLVLEGALDALPPFQEHEDASVRYAAAGVLVNVCGSGAEPGAAAGAAAAALRVAASTRDAPAAALLARALWNSHAHRPLPPAHAHLITAALAAFIDDDSVFTACAARSDDCDTSDPEIKRHNVKFEMDNQRMHIGDPKHDKNIPEDHHGSGDEDWDRTGYSGEDLGFEEGDITGEEECGCEPCRRLAAWDELVGVAIPLLEKLKPPRADASVGTE